MREERKVGYHQHFCQTQLRVYRKLTRKQLKKYKKFVQYPWWWLSGQLFLMEKDDKEMCDPRELYKNRDGKYTNTTESKIK